MGYASGPVHLRNPQHRYKQQNVEHRKASVCIEPLVLGTVTLEVGPVLTLPKLTWNLKRELFKEDGSLQRAPFQVPCKFGRVQRVFQAPSQDLHAMARRLKALGFPRWHREVDERD